MKSGQDSVSYSSSIGSNAQHMGFKVKYCHKIFDDTQVEKRCAEIFQEVSDKYGFILDEIGFDRDHVHIDVDGGPNYAPKDIAKLLKGTSGRKLLKEFPYLKKRHFWGSGLWNPSYYFDSVGSKTKEQIDEYIRNQGNKTHCLVKGQKTLNHFVS